MSLKILLVDDQPDAIILLAMLLRMDGLDVRGVTNGTEALRMAADWQPNVICVDLGMPGMNGYDLASRLRRAEPLANLRIIAISGYAADPELLEPAGIDMHLLKPVDIAALRRAIHSPTSLRSAVT
jgi:CheY-like chemotaxis protein